MSSSTPTPLQAQQEEAFSNLRDALEGVNRHVRAALRYSAELPGIEGGPIFQALETLSRVTVHADALTTVQLRHYRSRLAAAEETIPPDERG